MFGLIPRETVFFDLFEQAAANILEGTRALVDLTEHFENVPGKAKKIKDIEHQGDQLTHQTIERLNKTFITPIDREDIHELICRLDDILDLIDTAVNRIVLYNIKTMPDDVKALARVLQRSAEIIDLALKGMRDMKRSDHILKLCIDVHTQENEGDRIEQHALAEMFKGSMTPFDVIKWKDIYEDLEAATDRCEDVANVIEGIVLKNA